MNQDAIQADALRDTSHAFAGSELNCTSCGRPRWAHSDDGHHPLPSNVDPKDTRYRSSYRCHPHFSRPNSLSNADRKELARISAKEAKAELIRQRQAQRKGNK